MKIKGFRIASALLTIAILIPFTTNLCGRNLYIYFHLKDGTDFVLGAANGAGIAGMQPDFRLINEELFAKLTDREIPLLEFRPVEVFAESSRAPFSLQHFQLGPYFDEYFWLELPWLLLLLLPASLWLATSKIFAGRSD